MIPTYVVFLVLFRVTYEFNKVSGKAKEKKSFFYGTNGKAKTSLNKKNEFLIKNSLSSNKGGLVQIHQSKRTTFP